MKIGLFVVFSLLLLSTFTEARFHKDKRHNKPDDSLQCTVCELLVTVAEQLIPASETVDDIVAKLEKVCQSLPQFQTECKLFVDTYGKHIVKELLDHVPAQNICRELNVCPKAFSVQTHHKKDIMHAPELKHKLKEQRKTALKSVGCEVCKLVIAKIETFISAESTEQQIIAAVQKVCDVVPYYVKPMCNAFITEYGQIIIRLLVSKFPADQICNQIGLCEKSNSELPYMHVSQSGTYCEVCKFVIGELEKYIAQNSTEQQIVKAVEQVCTFLPPTYSGICTAFVDQYAVSIIEALVNKYDSKTVCTYIGLCQSSTKNLVKAKPIVAPKAVVCEICKYVMNEIEKYIGDNATEQQIIGIVEHICTFLPKTLQGTCNAFIEEYGASIISYLVNKYPADQICAELGLCKKITVIPFVDILPAGKKVKSSVLCAACEFVLNEIEKYLGDNATEQQIIDAVEQVCSFVPKSYSSICKAFIDSYGPEIIQLLLNKYPPDVICKAIGVCKSNKFAPVKIVSKENSVYCEACKYVINEIDKYLGSNATTQQIIHVVENICNFLPASIKGTCNAFIEEYGAMIINLFINKYPPDQVCASIKLCPHFVDVFVPSKIPSKFN